MTGRTACRPGCCPAGTRPRSSRKCGSCMPASSAAPPAAAAEAARSQTWLNYEISCLLTFVPFP